MNVLPNSDGAGLRAAARRGLRRGRDFSRDAITTIGPSGTNTLTYGGVVPPKVRRSVYRPSRRG
ncbi:hypothetical protein C9J85_11165 [Haloferax sp. wsp5]|nr:hypothetical protein C9J85_11165 [Haloferax sp. wsp5]